VSWHGIALNVAPDLGHYAGIVPCGISEHGVTSLHALGIPATMAEADSALRVAWTEVFERRRVCADSAVYIEGICRKPK
jgi:lipoyl(octanoyl) transferase